MGGKRLASIGVAVAAAVLLVTAALAGTAGTVAPERTATANADVVTEAKKIVQQYVNSKVPFTKPNGAFSIGRHKVAIISCGQAGIGCKQMSAFAQSAAKAAGWTTSPTYDGQFNPAKQAGFVQQSLQQGYDAIVLASIDAASIKAAVDAAAAKGVPVACIMCWNPGFKGKVIDTTTGGYTGGYVLANWVIADSNGKAKALGFRDTAFPIVSERFRGVQAAFRRCKSCTYKQQDIPTTDLSKPGPPTFTGALTRYPRGTLDYVMNPYDFFSLSMGTTAKSQGRTELKITGFDAWSDAVKAIGAAKLGQAATIAAPFEYVSWAAIDQVGRKLAGRPTWKSNSLPVALVVKANAKRFTSGYYRPPFNVQTLFKSLWKK